jgi:DNA repair exonuclease SbcCD ATPase subunit
VLGSDAVAALKSHQVRVQEMAVEAGQLDAQQKQLQSLQGLAEDRAFALIAEADLTAKARMLLEGYSEEEQEALRRRVEGLVSRGLAVIFGDGYGFRVEVGQSRGQASMTFWIVTPSGERDPIDSHGGGVVNVVSFVLRVVVTALTPGLGRVLVLDEPFAQLSQEYLEPMGAFLRELVDATDIQLFIVSHEDEIVSVADNAYRLRKQSGVTVVSEIPG